MYLGLNLVCKLTHEFHFSQTVPSQQSKYSYIISDPTDLVNRHKILKNYLIYKAFIYKGQEYHGMPNTTVDIFQQGSTK